MKTKITQYLRELEEKNNIKILLACETGSRAWGFPSPDSDYDVRMIYVHKKDWYITLSEERDSIELMLDDNEIDISGWELRKSLLLLSKSNGAMLERIQSPILYICDEQFSKEINDIAKSCYSRIATIYHYSSLAKKSLESVHANSEYKLKKLFYALRAAVACLWITQKDGKPPIQFEVMLNTLSIPHNVLQRIHYLIEFKSHQNETYLHTDEQEIIDFIRETLALADEMAHTLPSAKLSMSQLNSFFKKYVSDE